MVVHGLGHTKALGGHCNDTRAGKLPGRCEPARVLFDRPWAMHWAMHWATFLSWVTLQQILQVRYSIFLHHGTIWYPISVLIFQVQSFQQFHFTCHLRSLVSRRIKRF